MEIQLDLKQKQVQNGGWEEIQKLRMSWSQRIKGIGKREREKNEGWEMEIGLVK